LVRITEEEPAIVCQALVKTYTDGESVVTAVDDFSADFLRGEMTAITGPSGSGKTTLLNLIAAIDYPDDGEVRAQGSCLSNLSRAEQADYRASYAGVVHSDSNLLPMLTVYENLSLALSLQKLTEAEIDSRIKSALGRVGIVDLAHRLPGALSSGERARAALARAVAMHSTVIIADEPTAHLDHETAGEIAHVLRALAESGTCVVVATHDAAVSDVATRVVMLVDGRAVT
jgi:ABC-type lipoprotein export system ATPase subunit